jgi:hypothetical protein
MELLLNLAWLLLVLPACYLWHESRMTGSGRKFSSGQALLALACMLVLLFPVVSVTDDLHVMRAEIEESASSKRAVRQASNDKAAACNLRMQSPPAIMENLVMPAPGVELGQVVPTPKSWAATRPAVLPTDRAPPAGSLA